MYIPNTFADRTLDNMQCTLMMIHLQTWTIQSSNGIVVLEFGSFDVQWTPLGCWQDDYVEISYGSFSQKYCNQFIDIPGPIPGPFTSFGSPITVKFRTGSTGTNTGFLAAACCGVTVTNNINTGKQKPLPLLIIFVLFDYSSFNNLHNNIVTFNNNFTCYNNNLKQHPNYNMQLWSSPD